jgi:hypothetical protein
MGKKRNEAKQALDYALFRDVFNMRYDENRWQITFEGDNYVVRDLENNKLYGFKVSIKPSVWEWTQAIEDQEWDI